MQRRLRGWQLSDALFAESHVQRQLPGWQVQDAVSRRFDLQRSVRGRPLREPRTSGAEGGDSAGSTQGRWKSGRTPSESAGSSEDAPRQVQVGISHRGSGSLSGEPLGEIAKRDRIAIFDRAVRRVE